MYEQSTGYECPYVDLSPVESRVAQFVHQARVWEGVTPMLDAAYQECFCRLDEAGRWLHRRLATHYLSEIRKLERAEYEARVQAAGNTGGGEGKT